MVFTNSKWRVNDRHVSDLLKERRKKIKCNTFSVGEFNLKKINLFLRAFSDCKIHKSKSTAQSPKMDNI